SISNNSQASCCECKTLLKKPIRTSKEKIIYKPIKVYLYQSILSQLATLLQRPGFEELLESCYERGNTSSNIFSDLYDGQVLIPGPKEPPTEKINLYLDPLVDEFKQLWAGQSFATMKYPARRMYYGALILVSCDTPARNKICGFSSHSSKHACFKCRKLFKTNDTSNQSNINNYTLRTIEEHKIIAEKWKYSVSSECKQLFDQYAYKMMKIWTIETDLISKNQLINIQNIVNNSPPPASIGRILYKIASSFSGFTSDQWKTWTLIYSTMALRDILPIQDQK
ncbi:1379_t:CDS:2, partial [Dentiscutata erythropus]